MITLEVADYCQTCPHFEVRVIEIYDDFKIRCAKRMMCSRVEEWIKGQMENEEKESEVL